jgi:hypothetical protein
MSKLAAMCKLPGNQKVTFGYILDWFIKDYETVNGDKDPAQWFSGQKWKIETALKNAGIDFDRLNFDAGKIAYDYYGEA